MRPDLARHKFCCNYRSIHPFWEFHFSSASTGCSGQWADIGLSDRSQPHFLRRAGLKKMNLLKKYREKNLISKAELARKAGISSLTIDRIEKGKSCRLETKKKIILALGLKLSEKNRIFRDELD